MINIPAGLEKVIESDNHGPLKSFVYMYRNKWNSTANKYEVEAEPTDITKWLIKPSNLVMQLDLSEVNRYDASNVTLSLKNVKNEFVEGVEGSFFPEGYLLYGSKFEYYVGASDALKVLMYTGTIAEEPTYRTEDYQADVRVVSDLELFKKKECSEFANQIAGEKLTGTFPDYATAHIGVGNVLKVYSGTPSAIEEELVLGVDYTIDSLNKMLNPASVKIINEDLNGKTFYADYYYWPTDLKIHEVVNSLLDVIAVPQAKRQVEEVIFNSNVKNQIVATSQALGLGFYKEGDNDYVFNWLPVSGGNWRNIYAIKDNTVRYRKNIMPSNFELNFNLRAESFSGVATGFHAAWALGAGTHSTQLVNNGLYIALLRGDNISTGRFARLTVRSVNNGVSTTHYTGSYIGPLGSLEFPIKVRKLNNNWEVFIGGVSRATFSKELDVSLDALYSSDKQLFSCLDYKFTILNYSGASASEEIGDPTLLSLNIDKGNSSDFWGNYACTLEGTGFTYLLQFATSADGSTFGAWQTTDINTNAGGTDRYLKYKFSIASAPPTGCNVRNLNYIYLSNNLNINFVNLSDKTVLEGLEDLALISGYEFGFTRNNTFFFRQRIKSTDAVKILTDREIIKVSTVKKNLNNLFTKVQVNFGGVPAEVYTNDYETTRPTLQDKYGILTKTIDKPDLLNFDNPELANAIAPQLLEIFGVLNNTINATAALDLSLELGDVISLRRNAPATVDKTAPNLEKYTKTQTYYKACKIIGMNYNLKDRQMSYTFLDVSNKNTEPQYEADVFKYEFGMQFGQKD